MLPLWLDYHQPRPGRHWPGKAILFLSVILTCATLNHYRLINQSLEIKERSVSDLKRQIDLSHLQEKTTESSKGKDSITKQAARSIKRWETLFGVLEDAGDDTVTLIAIAPSPHEVSITGEAKDIGSALGYLKRLQASKVLTKIHITEQEILKDHPRHPLRFTLLTSWAEISQ